MTSVDKQFEDLLKHTFLMCQDSVRLNEDIHGGFLPNYNFTRKQLNHLLGSCFFLDCI